MAENKETVELKEAIETLCNALREDKSEGSYYHSWLCNISMTFKDELNRYYEEHGNMDMGRSRIHKVTNKAAENFLNLLIGK